MLSLTRTPRFTTLLIVPWGKEMNLVAQSAGEARSIRQVVQPVEVPEGAGARVRRALPASGVPYVAVDPFLLLDDARIAPQAAFPDHPHRGFEIITYILEGSVQHTDSEGNVEVVQAPGLQKITTGRGITHGEMPGPGGRPARALQLWINLARAQKQVVPHYQYLHGVDIPTTQEAGATVRHLAGPETALVLHTPVMYHDVTVAPGQRFVMPLPEEYNSFAYVLAGEGIFGRQEQPARAGTLLVLGPGAAFVAQAQGQEPLRVVLGAGRPHREPVYWRGPFVD